MTVNTTFKSVSGVKRYTGGTLVVHWSTLYTGLVQSDSEFYTRHEGQ